MVCSTPHQIQSVPIRRPFLPSLLSGLIDDFEPLIPGTAAQIDAELDPRQRDAVTRAMSTPDILLVQGWPGTGKSRVIREIMLRATDLGERVLLLAASQAGIDQVLVALCDQKGLAIVRCAMPGERLEDVSPCLRRVSVQEQLRTFEEETVRPARQALARAIGQAEARRREEAAWTQLMALAQRQQHILDQTTQLEKRLANSIDDINAECATPSGEGSTPFQKQWHEKSEANRAETERLESTLNLLRTRAEEVRTANELTKQELERVKPFVDAKKEGRWWSISYWRATAGMVAQLDSLEKAVVKDKATLAELDDRIAEHTSTLNRHRAALRADLALLRDMEIAARQAALLQQRAALEQEREELATRWRTTLESMCPETCPPSSMASEDVSAARATRDLACAEESRKHERIRQWTEVVESALPGLPAQAERPRGPGRRYHGVIYSRSSVRRGSHE